MLAFILCSKDFFHAAIVNVQLKTLQFYIIPPSGTLKYNRQQNRGLYSIEGCTAYTPMTKLDLRKLYKVYKDVKYILKKKVTMCFITAQL